MYICRSQTEYLIDNTTLTWIDLELNYRKSYFTQKSAILVKLIANSFTYFELILCRFRHVLAVTLEQLLRCKCRQCTTQFGINVIAYATEIIGWIFNGDIDHFWIILEFFVDNFNEHGTDADALERWQYQHLTDARPIILRIRVVQVDGCVADGGVHCLAIATCIFLIPAIRSERRSISVYFNDD